MSRLKWHGPGEKKYELGVDQCVLYPINSDAEYRPGVAWNGVTSISETPEGGEASKQYADNVPYLVLTSAEELNGTINAFHSPPEFDQCDGSAEIMKGVSIGQQNRKAFGLCYRTKVGNDVDGQDAGYILHLLYNSKASPSDRTYETVNDSPSATEFSWEYKTAPVDVTGYKPTSLIKINSTLVDPDKLAALEDVLYGSDTDSDGDARLPLPDEVFAILGGDVEAASEARFNSIRS